MSPESSTAGTDGVLTFLSRDAVHIGTDVPLMTALIEANGTPILRTSLGESIENDNTGSVNLDLS